MSNKDNRINFFVPLEFEKGNDLSSAQKMKIKGVCSTSARDTDGEVLYPSGFDFSPLLQKGFLNWNHQGSKTSSAIIGRPTTAAIINGGQDFYIEGFLYNGSSEARSVYELAEILENEDPDRRLGFSIEGQATRRGSTDKNDPRYKEVLEARITGVAITPCPKNPNTLMSLVKGEYEDAFVEDETEDDEEQQKAMTAEGAVGVTAKESVMGGQKILNEMNKIEKSEVYSQIIDQFATYDENLIKSVYSIIEKVSETNNMEKGVITQEIIDKSFDLLKKAQEEEALLKQAPEVEEKQDDKAIAKSEAATTAALSVSSEAITDLIKGTISEQLATIMSSNKKEEIDFTAINDLVKAEVTSLGENITEKFTALGSLLKSQFEQSGEFAKQVEDLKKSLDATNEELQAIKTAPSQLRSVIAQPIERFEKSLDADTILDPNTYNLAKSEDVTSLKDRLFTAYSEIKGVGKEDHALYKAIQELDIVKGVLPASVAKIQSMGIKLVNNKK